MSSTPARGEWRKKSAVKVCTSTTSTSSSKWCTRLSCKFSNKWCRRTNSTSLKSLNSQSRGTARCTNKQQFQWIKRRWVSSCQVASQSRDYPIKLTLCKCKQYLNNLNRNKYKFSKNLKRVVTLLKQTILIKASTRSSPLLSTSRNPVWTATNSTKRGNSSK